jgi:cell division protein FtsW
MVAKRNAIRAVPFLFFVLIIFGLIMLNSAGSALGQATFDDPYFFIKRQILYGFLPGIVCLFFFAKYPYEKLKQWSLMCFLVCIIFLVLVFMPGIGSSLNTQAASWIKISNFTFQPSEFAKIALIIFMSAYISVKGKEMLNFKSGFLVAVALGMIPIALITKQPDIGTASILLAILISILFVSQTRATHIAILTSAALAGVILMIIIAPYRTDRLKMFLHPELDPQGKGYQTTQSLVAVGTGGFFGYGLGHSRQKFQYLPQVHSDSIFAILSEELGFFISSAYVILLVYIFYLILNYARGMTDEFGRLLLAGIIAWFASQTFLNIGATIGILPLTGVPLVFMSHGGTALMMAMAAVGIILNILKSNNAA